MEKKKNRFNKAWMQEHVTDHYVQEAKRLGYRARAAFKLLEIDERDELLKAGQTIVDLGSAPGSWSQVAAARLQGSGVLIALDLLPMEPIHGAEFIQGDFNDASVLEALEHPRVVVAAVAEAVVEAVAASLPQLARAGSHDFDDHPFVEHQAFAR